MMESLTQLIVEVIVFAVLGRAALLLSLALLLGLSILVINLLDLALDHFVQ